MRVRQLSVFTGPNIYAHRPVVRALVAGEGAGAMATEVLQERIEFLSSASKELSEALATIKALVGQNGAMHWAEFLGVLTVALQDDRFPEPLTYWVDTPSADHEKLVVVETNEPELGEIAGRTAAELTQFIYVEDWRQKRADALEELAQGFRRFLNARSRVRFNENTRILLEAARDRDIPMLRLVPISEVMVLGQGHKRKRLSQCMGDTTSAVAIRVIARSKAVTSQVLREAAVPVPRQFVVRTETQLSDAVKQIGFPLVVKGSTVEHGASVTTGVSSDEELRAAVKKVQQFETDILIEQQIEGDDYRLTVINGRLVASARRTPPRITGDGQTSIRDLMVLENTRRRTLGRFSYWLFPLRLDDDTVATLARQGHSEESVPQAGEVITLRSVANLSQGGLSEDVTDLVHPDVAFVAERAARAVGLDMVGIDVITTDITRPLRETRGAILEVNNWPGLRPHYVTPTPPRDVAGAVIDYLFPNADSGRIPTVAVTGTNGKTTTCRLLRRIFETAGRVVGMSTTNEVVINGDTIIKGDCAGGAYAAMIVKDPIVEAGVFEMARGALVRHGSRLDGYSVGVVTNVTDDHLGLEGIETLEDMARIKRLVAEIARDGVVLNADDALCAAMASHVSAAIWWFTRDPDNSLVRHHLDQGGNAVIIALRDDREVLLNCSGDTEREIIATAEIPATWNGLLRVNVENAAAAAAAALAAGVDMDTVRAALTSFSTSFEECPGRLNIHKVNGATIILDFAHNVEGLLNLTALTDRLPCDGRRLCFYSLPNSRQPAHYDQVTAVLAHHFDRYIVSDETPLGDRRSETEITDWLINGLIKAGVEAQLVEGKTEVWDGVSTILDMARPGDVVLIKSGADPSPYWERITNFEPAT